MIAGVDYGSKLAGTTALAIYQEGKVLISQSKKKEDADLWLTAQLSVVGYVGYLFLDAPLSLPRVFRDVSIQNPNADYFYRAADKALNAMSPMFLGGLTARAMKLAAALCDRKMYCLETYPAALANHLGLVHQGYKKDASEITQLSDQLSRLFHLEFDQLPANWHQFDAVLAMVSGIRYLQSVHTAVGDEDEGVIIF